MSLKHLTSKLLAGGLTAGIVLIWWPRHYPTDGLEWLVLRGIVATLGFELMLLAYTPIEDRIAARLARRRAVGALRARAQAVPAPARTGGSLVFAVGALALPLLLLASAGAPPPEPAEPEPVTRVVREIVVKRQVVHDQAAPASASTAVPEDEVTMRRAAFVTEPERTRATTADPAARRPDRTTAPAAKSPASDDTDRTTSKAQDEPAVPVEPAGDEPQPTTTTTSPTPAPPADADASTAASEPVEQP
ncbi:MAG TPA: hypothetical protein VFR97_14275 [Capillimicrobium sp.]|nr:hypothetical protein [Capillimicrobium sp.]